MVGWSWSKWAVQRSGVVAGGWDCLKTVVLCGGGERFGEVGDASLGGG